MADEEDSEILPLRKKPSVLQYEDSEEHVAMETTTITTRASPTLKSSTKTKRSTTAVTPKSRRGRKTSRRKLHKDKSTDKPGGTRKSSDRATSTGQQGVLLQGSSVDGNHGVECTVGSLGAEHGVKVGGESNKVGGESIKVGGESMLQTMEADPYEFLGTQSQKERGLLGEGDPAGRDLGGQSMKSASKMEEPTQSEKPDLFKLPTFEEKSGGGKQGSGGRGRGQKQRRPQEADESSSSSKKQHQVLLITWIDSDNNNDNNDDNNNDNSTNNDNTHNTHIFIYIYIYIYIYITVRL